VIGQRLPIRLADDHDLLQTGAVRTHVVDHRGSVGAFHRGCRHQQPDTGLMQDVAEFGPAVGRVDGHQDGADVGGGVLQHRPLRAVACPDPYPVTLLDAHPQQAPGERRHAPSQLRVGPSSAGGHIDERLPVAEGADSAMKVLPDRFQE
jgi:hypothetical protein